MPILSKHFYRSLANPLPYTEIKGLENIDKLIVVDQSPIGRTPRSNPATYTNVFGDIRKLFENTPDAKVRGFKAGRFSFNVKGGSHTVHKALKNSLELRKDVFQSKGKRKRSKAGWNQPFHQMVETML